MSECVCCRSGAVGDVASTSTPVHFFVTCNGLEANLTSCVINDDVAQYRLTPTTYIHIGDVFVVCRLEVQYSRKCVVLLYYKLA